MKLVLSLILSFIFLLWFVASVVGMVYVSRSAELSWLIPVILGQFFLVIGTAGLIAMLRAKKKGLWIDIVAMLVGAIILLGGLQSDEKDGGGGVRTGFCGAA